MTKKYVQPTQADKDVANAMREACRDVWVEMGGTSMALQLFVQSLAIDMLTVAAPSCGVSVYQMIEDFSDALRFLAKRDEERGKGKAS